MDKLKSTLAVSIAANIGLALIAVLYHAVAKDAIIDSMEYKRYIRKMAGILTDEQSIEMAKYAADNIEFRKIVSQ